MDEINMSEQIEFITENETNQVNIDDPFIVTTDSNSSNGITTISNSENNNQNLNNADSQILNDATDNMIINDSIQNQEIENDKNLNEINHFESDRRSDVIDLMYQDMKQDSPTTNENLTEELNLNLDVVVQEEEVRITVDKQTTKQPTTEFRSTLTDISNLNTDEVPNKSSNYEIPSNLVLPSSRLSLRPFSKSKISIQKLPKNRPSTSAAANAANLNNKEVSSSLDSNEMEKSNKTDISNKKTKANASNKTKTKELRYRQVKIVRIIRQTTVLTFREEFNSRTNDYETMNLISTKKTKEMESETTQCRIISEKEHQNEETKYFNHLNQDNEKNFSSNSSANSSMSEENHPVLTNSKRTKQQQPKQEVTTAKNKKRGKQAEDLNTEDSEQEDIPNKKKINTPTHKNTPAKVQKAKRTNQINKLINKPLTKTPLGNRDLNSYSASDNGSVAGSNRSARLASSSLYTASRASSIVSSSPSIDSIVFENEPSSKKTSNESKKDFERFKINLNGINDPAVKNRLMNDILQVKLRKLSYNEMASSDLFYKSDESNENLSDSDDTLLNTTTLSQQGPSNTNNIKDCTVKLLRMNLPNGHNGNNQK